MKTLYLECKMGAAGDMLMASLYELLSKVEQKNFLEKMNHAGIPGLELNAISASTAGIGGTKMQVRVYGEEECVGETDHAHDHSHNHDDSHTHDDSHAHDHSHDHDDSHAHDHSHDHDDSHAHDHSHNHTHDHTHDNSHALDHAHDHSHSHADSHVHTHDHIYTHAHVSYAEMLHHISHLNLPEQVKSDAAEVYRLIGEAESKVHQSTLEQIHFHEVGTLDALADVVGCCLLVSMLEPEQIVASPVCVGNGTVWCAHGRLPVPAPATAEIIKGIPTYMSSFDGELLTPTGAALLKHFVQRYEKSADLRLLAIGYGIGTKEFENANCVRAFWGISEDQSDPCASPVTKIASEGIPEIASEGMPEITSKGIPEITSEGMPEIASEGISEISAKKPELVIEETAVESPYQDEISEICCNLDDMTPEAIGQLYDPLFSLGALDVYTTPIFMKKNRPAVMLTCLCKTVVSEKLELFLLENTTSNGVRSRSWKRKKLESTFETLETEYGPITVKKSIGYGIEKQKAEYQDVNAAAEKYGVPFWKIQEAIWKAK